VKNSIQLCIIIIITIGYFKSSYGVTEKSFIQKKIQNLENTPVASLSDSINDIVYYLFEFEGSYGAHVLESIDSLLPVDAVEAKTITKHYLYEFDSEHKYARLDTALKFAREHNNDSYYISYLITKANLFYFDQIYDSSIVNILKAREIVKESQTNKKIEIQHLLGDLFFAMGLIENAEAYYSSANALINNPEEADKWRIRVINNNLGLIEIQKENYRKAIEIFQNPINNLTQTPLNYSDSLIRCYLNRKISYCLARLETQLDSAINLSRFSIYFSKKYHLDNHLIPSYLNFIRLFIETNQPDSVKYYLTEYTNSFPVEDLPYDYKIEDILLKSEVFEYLGDINKAFEYQKEYITLQKSVHLNEKATEIIRLLTDQDYGKLVNNYNQVNNQRKNLTIATIISIMLVVLILTFLYETYRLNKKLTKSNQTKDKLFSIISHDLRSPFQSINGFSEIISESLKNKEYQEAETYNKVILDSSNNLIDLINNLLLWSKAQQKKLTIEPSIIEANKIIQNLINWSELQAKRKSISIKVEANDDLKCFIDKQTVSIVLNNLISNALKFSYPGSEILVKAVRNNNYVDFTVSDNGIGISKEKLKNLFDSSKTKSTRGTEKENGSGLGLILCKEFTEINKGIIKVESELNIGTKFIVSFPLA